MVMADAFGEGNHPPLGAVHVAEFRRLVHASQFVWEDVCTAFRTYASRHGIAGGGGASHPLLNPSSCNAETCRLFWAFLYRSSHGVSADDSSDTDSSCLLYTSPSPRDRG